MNEQMKKNSIIGGIALTIFLLGFGIGFAVFRTSGSTVGENTFQAGWDAAKKRLVDSGYIVAAVNEVLNVSGEVVEVGPNNLVIKIRPLEPLADPALDMRVVKIDSATKINQSIQKDPIVYQREIQEYNRRMQQAGVAPTATGIGAPPEMFEQKAIQFSSIKVGDRVTIGATQNIKDSKEFVAVVVSVQVIPAQIPPPPVGQ